MKSNTLKNKEHLLERLIILGACSEACKWVESQPDNIETIWLACPHRFRYWFARRNQSLSVFQLYVKAAEAYAYADARAEAEADADADAAADTAYAAAEAEAAYAAAIAAAAIAYDTAYAAAEAEAAYAAAIAYDKVFMDNFPLSIMQFNCNEGKT